MKRLVMVISVVACLTAAAPASAKVKPLTYKESIQVLGAAANDLESERGEEVLDGDCEQPRHLKASCHLFLRREGARDDACRLDVTVRKSKAGYSYRARYASGKWRMRFYCAVKS